VALNIRFLNHFFGIVIHFAYEFLCLNIGRSDTFRDADVSLSP
jgi:hypothetical protein